MSALNLQATGSQTSAPARDEVALAPPVVLAFGSGAALAARGFREDGQGGSLVCSECESCGARAWPPLPRCHNCWQAVREQTLGRQGELYAFTVVHVAPAGWPVPYAIGYVDMPEGVRVFTHLRHWDRLAMGASVSLHTGAAGDQIPFWFEASAGKDAA